jgi:hypothetical protein
MNVYFMISAVLILSAMGLYKDGSYSSSPDTASPPAVVVEVANVEQ